MGMFDRDKEFGNRIDQVFGLGVPFVLVDARIAGTITTKLGESDVAELEVARLDGRHATGPVFTASTIASAITAKVREAETSDFPAIVELRKVRSTNYGTDALVLQFVAEYEGADPHTGEVRE